MDLKATYLIVYLTVSQAKLKKKNFPQKIFN